MSESEQSKEIIHRSFCRNLFPMKFLQQKIVFMLRENSNFVIKSEENRQNYSSANSNI